MPTPDRPVYNEQRETPISRLDRAKEYLDSANVGLKILETSQLEAIRNNASALIRTCVENGGPTEGLAMVDTLIDLDQVNTPLQPDLIIWAHDMGGSNIRGTIFKTGQNNEIYIVNGRRGNPFYREEPLQTRIFSSMKAFGHMVASNLSPLFKDQPQPDAIATVFSFSGKPEHVGKNIDVMFPPSVEKTGLAKGFSMPGISERPVGIVLNEELAAEHGITIPPYIILNDTTAGMFSEEDRRISLVGGTGANEAVIIGNKVYNTAFPSYNGIPPYPLFERMDATTSNPGEAGAIKQTGGLYLGKLLTQALRELNEKGLISQEIVKNKDGFKEFDASYMTDILQSKTDRIGAIDQETLAILQEVTTRIMTRSAQIMGTWVAAPISEFPDQFRQNETITAQGTLIRKLPGYQEAIATVANTLLPKGRTVQLDYIANAGLMGVAKVGAAMATSRINNAA
jgi:hexokinase